MAEPTSRSTQDVMGKGSATLQLGPQVGSVITGMRVGPPLNSLITMEAPLPSDIHVHAKSAVYTNKSLLIAI